MGLLLVPHFDSAQCDTFGMTTLTVYKVVFLIELGLRKELYFFVETLFVESIMIYL